MVCVCGGRGGGGGGGLPTCICRGVLRFLKVCLQLIILRLKHAVDSREGREFALIVLDPGGSRANISNNRQGDEDSRHTAVWSGCCRSGGLPSHLAAASVIVSIFPRA